MDRTDLRIDRVAAALLTSIDRAAGHDQDARRWAVSCAQALLVSLPPGEVTVQGIDLVTRLAQWCGLEPGLGLCDPQEIYAALIDPGMLERFWQGEYQAGVRPTAV